MGKCINHPGRETRYICSKHGYYLCEECLECRDPKLYCKFRTACPIWFMMKERKSDGHEADEFDGADPDEHLKTSCK